MTDGMDCCSQLNTCLGLGLSVLAQAHVAVDGPSGIRCKQRPLLSTLCTGAGMQMLCTRMPVHVCRAHTRQRPDLAQCTPHPCLQQQFLGVQRVELKMTLTAVFPQRDLSMWLHITPLQG